MDFYGNQDLKGRSIANQIENLVIDNGADWPNDPPAEGQLFFNTTSGYLYMGSSKTPPHDLQWTLVMNPPADDFPVGSIFYYGKVGNASIPAGYTYYSAAADMFVRGHSIVGGGSGYLAHSHVLGHSHYYEPGSCGGGDAGGVAILDGTTEGWYPVTGHTHTAVAQYTNDGGTGAYSDAVDNDPEHVRLKLIKKTS